MKRRFDFPFLAALLRERLFPAGCALCGKTLLYRDEIWEGLCAVCASRFPVEEGARCRRCGKLLISEREMCLSCREEESVLDGAFSLYPYTGRFRELLSAWKFGKNLALGNLLARRLLAAASCLPLPPDTCWVPVPPRPGKIHHSGWDQIVHLAACLRRPGPGHSGVPVRPCLRRLSSKKQKELNRQDRRKNLRGRIVCRHAPPRAALLFDDVITTGFTLDACARALREAGAEAVYAITLFYD